MSANDTVNSERKAHDQLFATALRTPGLSNMRPGIVKEVLHYDMLFAPQKAGLLDGLVFRGRYGTSACVWFAASQ